MPRTTTKTMAPATVKKPQKQLISANSTSKAGKKVEKVKNANAKPKTPPPEISEEEDEEASSNDEDDEDENTESRLRESVDEKEEKRDNDHLEGFSTDDEDSSDEDNTIEDKGLAPYEISRLPTIAKDDEIVRRKLEKAKRQPTEDRGVVYIGRLPHGFYEDQLRGYFSQFGHITRLRVSRNKKTGRCKHYGFIEFDSSAVAQIVSETMDNYLLAGHILQCKLMPKDKVHPELWVGANRKWRSVPRDRIVRIQHNKARTEEEQTKANKRLLKRENNRKRKLQAAGIDYDFDAFGYKRTKEDVPATA